jgi:tetratricopeptide (TPR) repeat protein
MRWVLGLALGLAGCGSRDPDRTLREKLRPAQVEVPVAPERPVEVRTYALRVWATPGYRAENRDWQARFAALLDRAEAITGPLFGVRFAVSEYREWTPEPEGGLESALAALKRLDPGDGVDWVVGLATALPVVTSNQHQLGYAGYFSPHLVMRGLHDAAEYDAMARGLRHTDAEVRDRLYHDRLLHKELAVFLHEWAHTLGAIHVRDDHDFMSPVYLPEQAAYSPADERILRRSLDELRRPAAERDLAALAVDLRAIVAGSDGWDPGDRRWYLELLDRQTAKPKAEPRAEPKAEPAPDAGRAWLESAKALQAKHAVSQAEAALAHAPPGPAAEALAAANLRLRRRFGLPPGAERFGVRPDDEPAYVDGLTEALDALSAGDLRAAGARLDAAAKRFGAAPGVWAVRCQLDFSAGRRREALAACKRALDGYEETVFAHAWLGVIAAARGDDAQAAAHLERAIELDPDQRSAWAQLVAVREAAGDAAGAAAVRARYAARFGEPLP